MKTKNVKKQNYSVLQILKRAKKYLLQPDKWCKNTMEDGYGRCCAVGALNRGSGYSGYEYVYPHIFQVNRNIADALLVKIVQEEKLDSDITKYNDVRKTTLKDVIEIFDKAISLAKNKKNLKFEAK